MMRPDVQQFVSTIISRSRSLPVLVVLKSLVIVVSMLSLMVLGNAEAFAGHCEDECHDDCNSACDCIHCLPSLAAFQITDFDDTVSRTVLPPLAPDKPVRMEQKWFNSIDHPPQNSRWYHRPTGEQ